MAVALRRYAALHAALAAALFAAGVAWLAVQRGPSVGLAAVLLPVIGYAYLRSLWVSFAGVIAVVCLAPFATIPIGGPVTPTLLEVSLAVALMLRAAVLLIDRRCTVKTGGAQALWVALVGSTAFAFVLGVGRGYTTETVHTYGAFVLALGAFWLALQATDSRTDALSLVRLLLGGISAAAALALVLYAGGATFTERVLLRLTPYGYPGSRIVRYIEDDPAKPMRAVGTSVDPNSFGGLLMVGFVMAAGALLVRSRLVPQIIAAASLVVIGAALLLTYSRGAWVGAAIGVAMIVALRRPRWIVPMCLGTVVIVAAGIGRGFVERLWLGFTLQDPATRLRLAEYRNAWEIIRRHPLFGVGFGEAPSIELQMGVSSIYLTIAEQAGLVGLTVFLMTVAVVAWRGLRIARRAGPTGDVALVALAAFVAALSAGLVDHYFFNPRFAHMATLLWTLAGLLVGLHAMYADERRAFQADPVAVGSPSDRRPHGPVASQPARGDTHANRTT